MYVLIKVDFVLMKLSTWRFSGRNVHALQTLLK